MMKIILKIISLVTLMCLGACEKFLDEKANKKLVVPTVVADLQTLMDDRSLINEKEPNAGIIAADDSYLSTTDWLSLPDANRNLFVWQPNAYAIGSGNNWVTLYNQIYNVNVVLDHIDNVIDKETRAVEWQNVKGQALFLRARCYANLLHTWVMPYEKTKSVSDMGIPLRLDVNFNVPSVRASVESCYQQVLSDLRTAAALLPVQPLHPVRPSKAAAYALLARTYLSMNLIDSCLYYTERALEIKGDLMDYNGGAGINTSGNYAFTRFNPEVIYDTFIPTPSPLSKGIILSEIYDAYHANDLRKTLYHRTSNTIGNFKGTYSGGAHIFNGIASNELYLMKAECLARKGVVPKSLEILNSLLIKRFKTGTYVPYSAVTPDEALGIIMLERRKELIFRGLRWMDIRRLNRIGANITIKRVLDKEYVLEPNSPRYALPIPEDVVTISNIPQNPR
jgi:tetratricopeptide (TPR) repeat protein